MYRLALALGRTVTELRHTLTGEELAYWWAFDQLEPIGTLPRDFAVAKVAATVANAAMGSSGKFLPGDFVPWLSPKLTEEQDAQLRSEELDRVLFGG